MLAMCMACATLLASSYVDDVMMAGGRIEERGILPHSTVHSEEIELNDNSEVNVRPVIRARRVAALDPKLDTIKHPMAKP